MDWAQKIAFDHNEPPTPYKIKVNNCKLINLLIRIELTQAILMLRFSNFLRNSIIHFRMFLYLETCFLRVTVSFLCRLQAVSKIHVPIYPYLTIMTGDEIVRPCDQHNNETVTLMEHVPKCKNKRKLVVEFLKKIRIVALKLLELIRFLSPNLSFYSYLLELCIVLGVCCDVDIYKQTARAQSIYREVYCATIFLNSCCNTIYLLND